MRRRCLGIRNTPIRPVAWQNTTATNVTGGPGSLRDRSKDFNSFGEAIIKKMIAEIADAHVADGQSNDACGNSIHVG